MSQVIKYLSLTNSPNTNAFTSNVYQVLLLSVKFSLEGSIPLKEDHSQIISLMKITVFSKIPLFLQRINKIH